MKARRTQALLLTGLMCLAVGGKCGWFQEEPPLLEPVNVSNSPGRSESPSIAVDSRGTAHLVWTDCSDGENIHYAYRPEGGAWSVPVKVTDYEHRGARLAAVAVGPDDRVHLAWQSTVAWGHPGPRWRIFYSQKTVNGDWTAPDTLSDVYEAVRPKLAVDDEGGVHVIWQYGGSTYGVRYRCRTATGIWLPEEIVRNPDEFPDISSPAISADRAGNLHVAIGQIWPSVIQYYEKPRDGVWSGPLGLSDSLDVIDAWVGADSRGNVHFFWNRWNTRWHEHRMRRPDRTWTEIVPVCTLKGKDFTFPVVGVIGPGDELILPGLSSEGPFLVIKPPDSGFSDTILIGRHPPRNIWPTTAAVSRSGEVHLAWSTTNKESPDRYHDIFWLSCRPTDGNRR